MKIFLEFLLILTTILIICENVLNVEAFNLTLIHNNDLHSNFAQINARNSPCDEKTLKEGKCFGGVARIVSKVKEIREKHKKNTLFLNAGDSFQGTVWYSLYKWHIVSHFTKLLKYDVMTIGNHEFDDGVEGYAPFLDDTLAVIPTVCCNIDVSEEPKLKGKIKKSIVVEIDNKKIGIIGYITPETRVLSSPGNTIKFTDEIQCLKKEVKQMKSQGIDIIIGLGHSGYVRDVEIARNVPEIDVIVGGHSHSLLYSGPQTSIDEIVGKYPTIVDHGTHKALVLQAFAFGKYLGHIDIEFDELGNVYRFDGNPILLDNTIPEDPKIAKEVQIYRQKLKIKFGDVIGKTKVLLEGGVKCRIQECNLGNLLTEAAVVYYMNNRSITGKGWTDAAVSVMNGGSFRSSIDASAKDGNITLEDLMGVIPFEDYMTILVLTGNQIIQMLEHSVSGYDVQKDGKFLQMSGLKVVYNLRKADNQRVENVMIRCADCLVPDYKPLDNNKKYHVIIPSFLCQGGDGYHMLKNVPKIQTQALYYQIVSEYMSQTPVIFTGTDGRIVLRSHLVNSAIVNCLHFNIGNLGSLIYNKITNSVYGILSSYGFEGEKCPQNFKDRPLVFSRLCCDSPLKEWVKKNTK